MRLPHRTAIAALLVLGTALPTGRSSLRAQSPTPRLDLDLRAVAVAEPAPGVRYQHLRSEGRDGRAPLSIHLVRAHMDSVQLRPVLALDQILGQEAPSSAADRYGAVAVVNGGFSVSNDPWNPVHGDPNGFYLLNGRVLSEPVEPRRSLLVCREEGRWIPSIVQPSLEVAIRLGALRLGGLGLNRALGANDVVVYTPEWSRTTIAPAHALEIVVAGESVVSVRDSLPPAVIPGDGFVLAATGDASNGVRAALEGYGVGALASLARTVRYSGLEEPADLAGCDATSAGPRLVHGGEAVERYDDEGFRLAFSHERHPRTAVAWHADDRAFLLVVVDGRQPELSAGMTLPELARWLDEEQDVEEGYNLDGGGSSAMVLDGGLVNSPSDGRERRRSDLLLLLATSG